MGIARGWEKRVIRTNITYAKRTVRIFSVSPQSHSPFSASFQTFLFDCSRLLEYAKIRTVLQSNVDVKSKILFLFHNIDPFICKSVAAFIFEIMNSRYYHVISKVN